MRILFLSTRSPYPLISGHSLRTYHTLKGACRAHSVTLVTFIQLQEELRDENVRHLKNFCQNVNQFPVPVDFSKALLWGSLLRNVFSPLPFIAQKYDVTAFRERVKKVVSEGMDLVHVDLLPLAVYRNEFKSLPAVLINHNVESVRLYRWYKSERNLGKKIFLGLQWLKLRAFERSEMNKFECCVAVSELDKVSLEGMGVKSKIFVVPNGTDTDFFTPTSKSSEEKSALWIGHMDVHTNRDAVLYFWRQIYPILKRKMQSVKVTFVGTAPPREIFEFAETNGNVEVTGFVDDIRPHVGKAGVVMVPIRIGSGTRLKILDTMAMGKAIVSTSVGCEGLNVTNGKDIIVADTAESFAEGVVRVLKDGKLKKDIERNALELAKRYDWRLIVDKQEAAYEYALKKNKLNHA